MEDNSLDSVVTDPPYWLSFMWKAWDYDVPQVEVRKEVLRVLKPWGHLLSFAGSRTYHRMAVNIEDAGFEIRDQIMRVYWSWFPKSHNIGKAVDKSKDWAVMELLAFKIKEARESLGLTKKQAFDKCGMKAKTFGGNSWFEGTRFPTKGDYELLKKGLGLDESCDIAFEEVERQLLKIDKNWGSKGDVPVSAYGEFNVTKGSSPYEGWGTALKPAHEPIVVARKPLSEKTIAKNVLEWGTGGINIDGCRVGTEDNLNGGAYSKGEYDTTNKTYELGLKRQEGNYKQPQGRFPANFIHDGSDEVVGLFPETKSWARKKWFSNKDSGYNASSYEMRVNWDKDVSADSWSASRFFKTCPYEEGEGARFAYFPKASKKDRNEGLPVDQPSTHPTVKPTALMQYLVRLVTPVGGTVLDPFMGSGSTGKACKLEWFLFIGIEREEEYVKIAQARIEWCEVEVEEQEKRQEKTLFDNQIEWID